MYKNLTVCPICSFEGSTSSFVMRKQGRFIDKVLYKCPSCQKELALKEKDRKLIIIISISALLFFIVLFISGISKGIVGIIFTLIFACIWLINKLGLNDVFKVHLEPRE